MKDENEIKNLAQYCLNCPTKPCTKGCPLGNDIPGFIQCVKNGEYKEAFKILSKTTVLPAICGRICPHEKQCQGHCVRGIKGEPVSIGELEAFVGNMAIKENWSIDCDTDVDDKNIGDKAENELDDKTKSAFSDKDVKKILQNKKVAIVGSGPAGLTCAAYLAKRGCRVTIFDRHMNLGGLLRFGIPIFRLDREILEKQIKKIIDLGIEIEFGTELGSTINLDELRKKYDAVFLALGANVSRKMNIPGEDLDGVIGGNELLEYGLISNFNGKRVAVIGGGNVAMDASRTIKRLGADKVYVIYRRAEEQMPAETKEIADAKSEGVEFLFKTNLVRICNGDEIENIDDVYGIDESNVNNDDVCSNYGHVSKIECIKTELVKKEGDNRLSPVDIEGSNFMLDMDYVVMAIGAMPEARVLDSLNLKRNAWGCIDVDDKYMSSLPGVFVGGDLAGCKSTVAWAARSGRDAAKAICDFLLFL